MRTEPTGDWQDRFKSQMTRVTFTVTLTRAMLEFLCATSDCVHWDRRAFGSLGYADNWIATEHALTKRGLIRRKPPTKVSVDKMPPPWELTPAGEAMVELLKVGGLFIEAREAAEKWMARKGRK